MYVNSFESEGNYVMTSYEEENSNSADNCKKIDFSPLSSFSLLCHRIPRILIVGSFKKKISKLKRFYIGKFSGSLRCSPSDFIIQYLWTHKDISWRVSWFGACLYYFFACARFLVQAQFFIVYEPIVSK